MDRTFEITANRVDLLTREIAPVTVRVREGVIESIVPASSAVGYLLPGFVDSHIHIESSMLLPSEFARVAMLHGTVATVSDPHEIANVCGIEGIELMLRDAGRSPLKFYFGAPSCVPATQFETAGARIELIDIERLLDDERINHLCEMMNFPGVISGDPDVAAKLDAAKQRRLPIDGHAPGLRGDDAARYFAAGITTDHECVSLEEAKEKISLGCTIAIREGSAARNFEALWPLLQTHPESCMFCSDDKHPDELMAGHINRLVKRAVNHGCDLFDVLRAASLTPIRHYQLKVGLLQVGDAADFVLVDDLKQFQVRRTYIDGQLVADNGQVTFPAASPEIVNNFNAKPIQEGSLVVRASTERIRVIEVSDGQLLTGASCLAVEPKLGKIESDLARDVLKLAVFNRYVDAPVALAFVRGIGLQQGAFASSVAHDSHNIVAVGTNDADLAAAINGLVETKGGLSVANAGEIQRLALPVGGLMSTDSCAEVAKRYSELDAQVKELGSQLHSPFMTLSFLALPVIPKLKLTDRGLFDVDRFEFSPLFLSNN